MFIFKTYPNVPNFDSKKYQIFRLSLVYCLSSQIASKNMSKTGMVPILFRNTHLIQPTNLTLLISSIYSFFLKQKGKNNSGTNERRQTKLLGYKETRFPDEIAEIGIMRWGMNMSRVKESNRMIFFEKTPQFFAYRKVFDPFVIAIN